jgi:hypothetical protein
VLLRTNNLTPISRSREFTVWDSAGWLTCSRRDAADNPPASTIAMNAVSSLNSIAYGRRPNMRRAYSGDRQPVSRSRFFPAVRLVRLDIGHSLE